METLLADWQVFRLTTKYVRDREARRQQQAQQQEDDRWFSGGASVDV